MKIGKSLRGILLIAALVVLLCGCNSRIQPEQSVQEPTEVTQTDFPTEVTAPAEELSIMDLYEKTDIAHVYKLNTISTDGYSVGNAYLQDGYALVLLQDYSEEGFENEIGIQHVLNSGKIVLFPLNSPDAAVSKDVEHFEASYVLLAGGTVLEISWDGGYTLYDSSLKECYHESGSCGTFLGASETGDIWFLAEDSSFVRYRDGVRTQTEPIEGMLHGTFIGTGDGKAYFTMFNRYYGWAYSAIDLQSFAYAESQLVSNSYDAHNGKINYTADEKWLVTDLTDPFTVTVIPKQYFDESVCDMDARYLIGVTCEYNAVTDDFRHEYHVYDLQSGSLCDQISSDEFSCNELLIQDYSQDLVLVEAHNDEMATIGLYLWDLSELIPQEPAETFTVLDYHMDEARVADLIRQIYDQYGVSVYYDAQHLEEYSSGYNLLECPDINLIGYTLLRLQECMSEYPEGFFEEIKGQSVEDVVFCLCSAHERVNMYSIEFAAATVDRFGDTLVMSIDVHSWQELRQLFLHENTHMMETRLEEEMAKIGSKGYAEYWYTDLNLPDCPPIQSYLWEQTDENMKGVYSLDPENACYIDWYSKCTINEDHARIMEYGINPRCAYYYTAPLIDRKSRFLNAMIREAFPCVKNSGEVFWEARTGIVSLYQEFPDFVN